MKSLSLSRPLILMVMGVPGAGKSFFARQFAETFKAPLISFDHIRAAITETPTYSREEDGVVQALALQQTRELLKTQKTFLIDGGVNARTDRLLIQRYAQENDYGTLIIWVQTDEPTSKFRAMHRRPKRQHDALNASITAEQFASFSKRLTSPSPQEIFVVISGKHTYPTQAKVVLKKLVAPRIEATPLAPQPIKSEHHEPPVSHRRSISIS